MPKPQMLYHYTSLEHAQDIIASGHIKRAPSNLLKPKNLRIVHGVAIDPETDWYKPVVWLTRSESPKRLGLPQAKQCIRFSIPTQCHHINWSEWATENRMDQRWRRALTRGMDWQSWYVSEYEIPLDDVSEILDLATNTVIDFQHILAS